MAGDFVELLDAVDRAVVASRGVVAAEATARAGAAAADLRRRRGFQGQTLVLGLAGGTGTGKSSLLNAIAREPVASVSRLRPHTERPLAWVPAERGPGLIGLLDALGVSERVPQTRWPGLALVDLPDVDSVAARHRRIVEELIPQIDGVIWVFDPSKYADPSLHEEFLEPLSDYRDQFLFVLNKIDTLDAGAEATIMADLRRLLGEDGYRQPRVFPIAADPLSGEPRGIGPLEAHLQEELDAKRIAVSKWLIDIARELRRLGHEAGVWDGASVGLRERWARDREAALGAILQSQGRGGRSDAVCRLEDLVAMIAVEAGPRAGARIETLFPEGEVERALDEAEQATALALESSRRRKKAMRAAQSAGRRVLDQRIGRPLRAELESRARFGAVLAEAGLTAAALQEGTTPLPTVGEPATSSTRAEQPDPV